MKQASKLALGAVLCAGVAFACSGADDLDEPLNPGLSTPWSPIDSDGNVQLPTPPVERVPAPDISVLYPHTFPLAPEVVDAEALPAWTTSHGAAVAGDRLYVADPENDAIAVLSAPDLETLATWSVGGRPDQMVIGPNGTLFVSARHAGSVVAIDLRTGVEWGRASVGLEPIGLAMNEDGSRLYVAVAGASELVALDTMTLAETSRIAVNVRRPRAVMWMPGNELMVGGQDRVVRLHLADGEFGAGVSGSDAEMRLYRPSLFMLGEPFIDPTANRATAFAFRPGFGDALILHFISMPGFEESSMEQFFIQAEGGCSPNGECGDFEGEGGEGGSGYGSGPIFTEWPEAVPPVTGGVTADGGDGGGGVMMQTAAPVPDRETGLPLDSLMGAPGDIVHHPTHSLAFVSSTTHNVVVVLNTALADPAVAPLGVIEAGAGAEDIVVDPNGLYVYVVNRVDFTVTRGDLETFLTMPLLESQPQSSSAYVNEFGDDVVAPTRVESEVVQAYGADPLSEMAQAGRRIFFNATLQGLSAHSHFACATCHTEGEQDGLVWFIAEGARQTPSLLGRIDGTAPFNWEGSEDELDDNMSNTVARMGGNGLGEDRLAALEAFLVEGLSAPPRDDSPLSPIEMQGGAVFAERCGTCHAGVNTTDGQAYDVGTMSMIDNEIAHMRMDFGLAEEPVMLYNTPSLRDLRFTAPYLHSGEAQTLEQLLEMTDGNMWDSTGLSDDEIDALLAYLQRL